jgi:hypothetical protein
MRRFLAYGLLCLLFGLLVGFTLASKFGHDAVAAAEEPASVPIVRAAECRWATGPIQLDGVLDEPVWQNAQVLSDFAVYWQNRKPKTATKARLLWDDKHIYFAAEMEDADLYADTKTPNGQIWLNDVFELFFKPREDRLTYYEMQVNAAGTQLELFLPSRGSGGWQRFAPTSKFGMKSAVKLDGTLNHWQDTDRGWTVEGSIPLAAFEEASGKPRPGDKWRFALCRYDYSVTFDRVETSSSAPLTQPDFHRYEDYGVLTFVRAKE